MLTHWAPRPSGGAALFFYRMSPKLGLSSTFSRLAGYSAIRQEDGGSEVSFSARCLGAGGGGPAMATGPRALNFDPFVKLLSAGPLYCKFFS